MICVRCGTPAYALLSGNICTSCSETKKPEEDKKQRKPKSKHRVEQNILTYLLFIIENPEIKHINKRDFETLMNIPLTSVNYLITVLKKRGYIRTEGIVGRQKYAPIRTLRDCILTRIGNIRKLVNEN